MDQGTPARFSAALLAISLAVSCHWLQFKTIATDGIRCEVPRNWQESSGAGSLHVRAPEAVREVGAFISVYPGSPDTRAELEESIESAKRTFRGDPNFSSHPLVEVAVGGTRGYMRSETMTGFRKLFHRKTPLPEPVKVRRTIVSFNVGATGYEIMYMAPLELYDKHLPAFERVLRTLKVEPKP